MSIRDLLQKKKEEQQLNPGTKLKDTVTYSIDEALAEIKKSNFEVTPALTKIINHLSVFDIFDLLKKEVEEFDKVDSEAVSINSNEVVISEDVLKDFHTKEKLVMQINRQLISQIILFAKNTNAEEISIMLDRIDYTGIYKGPEFNKITDPDNINFLFDFMPNLMSVVPIITNNATEHDARAYAMFNDRTMSYEIHINTFSLIKDADELILYMFIIMHELMHILNRHLIDYDLEKLHKEGLDTTKVNIALDAAINQFLVVRNAIDMKVYRENFAKDPLYVSYGESGAYYLENMKIDTPDDKDEQGGGSDSEGQGEGSDSEGQGEGSEGQGQDSDSEGQGGHGNGKARLSDIIRSVNQSHNNWQQDGEGNGGSATDYDKTSSLNRITQDAIDNMRDKSRGLGSGQFSSLIESALTPPRIPWEKLIRKSFGRIIDQKINNYRRINRRFPTRVDLPGRSKDRMSNIFFAVDTSGSMSDKELQYALGTIIDLAKKRPNTKLHFIAADAKVQEDIEVDTAHWKNIVNTVEFSGRGGTYFTPTIHYLTDTYNFDSNLDLLIYFTDGYGEREIDFYNAREEKNFKNTVWLLTSYDNNPGESLPGTKLKFEMND